MKSFRKFSSFFIFCIAWAAFALPSRAQFIAHVAEGLTLGEGTPLYGDYFYRALSCLGNEAVVAATAESLSPSGSNGYYLAFFVSRDGGASWSLETQGLPGPSRNYEPLVKAIDIIDSLDIVAAGDSGLLVRSTDGGVSWAILPPPITHGIMDISFSDAMNGMFVAADTTHGTYITTDGGSNWTPVPFTRGYAWKCHAYGNGVYRVFVLGSGMFYTTKDNWTTVDSSVIISDTTAQQYGFYGCSFGGGDSLFAYGVHHTAQLPAPYISMSTNGGTTWRTAYEDSSSMWRSGIVENLSDARRDTIVASGNLFSRVLWSTDRGATWTSDTLICNDSGFKAYGNTGVAFTTTGKLIATFSDGITFMSSLVVGSREALSRGESPANSNTLNVFPNPASSLIEVTGATPATAVSLMDVLGREVVRANLSASGAAMLDVSHLPRGIYMLMLEWHGRMILVGREVLL